MRKDEFNSISAKKRLLVEVEKRIEKMLDFWEHIEYKALNIIQIKRGFHPAFYVYTYVRIYAPRLMHSTPDITNGLINREHAGKGRGFAYARAYALSIFVPGPPGVHVERIKNLVAPALIIERSMPCN